MAEEKLLTVREVSLLLGVSEKEVVDLVEKGSLPAYKIGGVYLRFKKDQILDYRRANQQLYTKHAASQEYPVADKVKDFFYFNDFYILASLLIIFLLVIILRGT